MPKKSNIQRNWTAPQVAEHFGVSPAKVITWIRQGELEALNLAHRGCTRPRYSISQDALEAFELARTVVPQGAARTSGRLRRHSQLPSKEYFSR